MKKLILALLIVLLAVPPLSIAAQNEMTCIEYFEMTGENMNRVSTLLDELEEGNTSRTYLELSEIRDEYIYLTPPECAQNFHKIVLHLISLNMDVITLQVVSIFNPDLAQTTRSLAEEIEVLGVSAMEELQRVQEEYGPFVPSESDGQSSESVFAGVDGLITIDAEVVNETSVYLEVTVEQGKNTLATAEDFFTIALGITEGDRPDFTVIMNDGVKAIDYYFGQFADDWIVTELTLSN